MIFRTRQRGSADHKLTVISAATRRRVYGSDTTRKQQQQSEEYDQLWARSESSWESF